MMAGDQVAIEWTLQEEVVVCKACGADSWEFVTEWTWTSKAVCLTRASFIQWFGQSAAFAAECAALQEP